jgi:D-amino-acid dehydrogenase
MSQHGNGSADVRLRVVVVGAGIVGVCCAAYLRRDGHDVTLLEAKEPAAGTSRGNAGAISPWSCVPLSMPGVVRKVPSWLSDRDGPLVIRPRYLPRALPWLLRFIVAGSKARIEGIADALRALHGPTYECYEPLVRDAGAQDLIRRTGALTVYRKLESFESSAREWDMRRRRGADPQVLGPKELTDLVPALAAGFQRGVLQRDHGYVADPQRLTTSLAQAFVARGGDLEIGEAAAIVPFEDGSIRVRLTDDRVISADRVVLATGAWSSPLVAGLGARIPLESQRGYHVTVPDGGIALPLPVSFAEAKFYATPMSCGLRIAGTVEFAGLHAPPDFRRAEQLSKLAKRWLPGLGTSDASVWMGHRPCLPDSLPVIGPAPRNPRVLFAFGHGHNGMTTAPVTGRLIADLIAGRKPIIDPAPYRPTRF